MTPSPTVHSLVFVPPTMQTAMWQLSHFNIKHSVRVMSLSKSLYESAGREVEPLLGGFGQWHSSEWRWGAKGVVAPLASLLKHVAHKTVGCPEPCSYSERVYLAFLTDSKPIKSCVKRSLWILSKTFKCYLSTRFSLQSRPPGRQDLIQKPEHEHNMKLHLTQDEYKTALV